jgi:hypothetical protein
VHSELQTLKSTLRITESLLHVAAARDALLDATCDDLRPHAARHNLRMSAALWTSLWKVLKRLGQHSPPAVAIDMERTADRTLVTNLQMMLRVGTALGGRCSRSGMCVARSRSVELWVALSVAARCWLASCSTPEADGSGLASAGRSRPSRWPSNHCVTRRSMRSSRALGTVSSRP